MRKYLMRKWLMKRPLVKRFLAVALTCLALAGSAAQTAFSHPSNQSGDQPTLQKDTLQITAWTNNSYKGNYDVWSWVPKLEFRVNGPIPSGSQLFVEFQQPGGASPWLSFDCATEETQKDRWWKTECGSRQVEDKSITTVGTVNFSIKMRNELAGSGGMKDKAEVARTKSPNIVPRSGTTDNSPALQCWDKNEYIE